MHSMVSQFLLWDEEKGATTKGLTTKTNGRGQRHLNRWSPFLVFLSCWRSLNTKMTRGPKSPDKKDTATKYPNGEQFPHPNSNNRYNFHFMIQTSPINQLKYQFNIPINLRVISYINWASFKLQVTPNLSMNTYHHTLSWYTLANPSLQEGSQLLGPKSLGCFCLGYQRRKKTKKNWYVLCTSILNRYTCFISN